MRVVTLPNGKQCSLGRYVEAWRTLKAMPETEHVKGFDHFPAPAGHILARIREGVQDRINTRGGLVVRKASSSRVFRLIQRAQARGAIRIECKTCGVLVTTPVNPNNSSTRFCSDSCRRSYFS